MTYTKTLIVAVLATVALLTSCAKQGDVDDLRDNLNEYALKTDVDEVKARVTALEQTCKQMNTNISSLQVAVQALQEADFITSITHIMEGDTEIGYTITFLKNKSITIYHGTKGDKGDTGPQGEKGETGATGATGSQGEKGSQGDKGDSPVISVAKESDGLYYWTINGQWLTDEDGNKVKAIGRDGIDGRNGTNGINGTDGKNGVDGINGINGKDGVTPQLKIENNKWWVSVNGGNTWTEIGSAVPDPLFKSVTVQDNNVNFALMNGTEFTLPIYTPITIELEGADSDEVIIKAGGTLSIPYTLTGTVTNTTLVTVITDGYYTAQINTASTSQGTINITSPSEFHDAGFVCIMVYYNNTIAAMKVINFCQGVMSYSYGKSFNVSKAGGELKIPIERNFDYQLRINSYSKYDDAEEPWLTIEQGLITRASVVKDTIVINIESNDVCRERKANLVLSGAGFSDTIKINQKGVAPVVKTFTVGDVSFDMIEVKGGRFKMGYESNYHSVVLDDYYIGKTEITWDLWDAIMGSKPSGIMYYIQYNHEYQPILPNYPVHEVSWYDCQEFIEKLNTLTGMHFRLPTEAEWEFAARGGNYSKGYKYSGSNDAFQVACCKSYLYPVASLEPNELGIYDMSGNVWEWCSDYYSYNYDSFEQHNPTGPETGTERILRGGDAACIPHWEMTYDENGEPIFDENGEPVVIDNIPDPELRINGKWGGDPNECGHGRYYGLRLCHSR